MPTRRIKSSHPDYIKINELMGMKLICDNPHIFRLDVDVPEMEHSSIRAILVDEINDWLEGGAFADYLSRGE